MHTMSPEDFSRVTARRVASSWLLVAPGASGSGMRYRVRASWVSGHGTGEERYGHLVSVLYVWKTSALRFIFSHRETLGMTIT